jgi:hypothetical protein
MLKCQLRQHKILFCISIDVRHIIQIIYRT